jgi:DNA adenine methylase
MEVLNDVDGEIVNVFRVLQNPKTFRQLKRMLIYTPYARAELERAVTIANGPRETSPVKRAWATMVRLSMGRGMLHGRVFGCSWKVNTAMWWRSRIMALDAFHDRLLGVHIENIDAIECIRRMDNPKAVFYVDPPYHPDTVRDSKPAYGYNYSAEDWENLVAVLAKCRGDVTLSCHYHDCLKPLLELGWKRIDIGCAVHARFTPTPEGVKPRRIETILINPKAQAMLQANTGPASALFS